MHDRTFPESVSHVDVQSRRSTGSWHEACRPALPLTSSNWPLTFDLFQMLKLSSRVLDKISTGQLVSLMSAHLNKLDEVRTSLWTYMPVCAGTGFDLQVWLPAYLISGETMQLQCHMMHWGSKKAFPISLHCKRSDDKTVDKSLKPLTEWLVLISEFHPLSAIPSVKSRRAACLIHLFADRVTEAKSRSLSLDFLASWMFCFLYLCPLWLVVPGYFSSRLPLTTLSNKSNAEVKMTYILIRDECWTKTTVSCMRQMSTHQMSSQKSEYLVKA